MTCTAARRSARRTCSARSSACAAPSLHPVREPEAVRIAGLTVVRGAKRVLQDVTLTVPTGSVTGLIGPSGCGKTTLMRAIVGVQVLARGSVTVLGAPAGDASL